MPTSTPLRESVERLISAAEKLTRYMGVPIPQDRYCWANETEDVLNAISLVRQSLQDEGDGNTLKHHMRAIATDKAMVTEAFAKSFASATGFKPEECEMVVQMRDDAQVIWFRKRVDPVPTKPTTEQVVEALKGWTWKRCKTKAIEDEVVYLGWSFDSMTDSGEIAAKSHLEYPAPGLIILCPPSPAPVKPKVKTMTCRELLDERKKISGGVSNESYILADRLDAIEARVRGEAI